MTLCILMGGVVHRHLSVLRASPMATMSSFMRFDVLGSDLATLDAVFMLFHWWSAGPSCACCRALDDTDVDALFVTEVDRCVQDQGKLLATGGILLSSDILGSERCTRRLRRFCMVTLWMICRWLFR